MSLVDAIYDACDTQLMVALPYTDAGLQEIL